MFDAPTLRIMPSARLCRLHLYRHGEVVGSAERRCRGQADVPLSEAGREQSARAAAWFGASFGRDARIYASDLSRCWDLATLLGDAPVAVPALREQHMGAWDGRTWAELTTADPAGTTAYWNDYVHARPPGGESYGDLYARVVAWWEAQALEGDVVLVTHIGVIRALLCHWFGLGPGEALRWAPPYASYSRVLHADAGAVIERFGETR